MAARQKTLPEDVTWDIKAGIHLRLLRARIQLRSEKLWTKFQGAQRDYDAFSIHELAAVCERVLAEHGVTYAFSVEDVSANGNYRMIKGWAIFICAERDDDDVTREFRVFTVGEGVDDSDKGFGKAISYARKSGLIQVLNLAIGTDNEASNIKAAPAQPAASGEPRQRYASQDGLSIQTKDGLIMVAMEKVVDWVRTHIDKMSTSNDVVTFRDVNASAFQSFHANYSRDLGVALRRVLDARIQTLLRNEGERQ